MDRRQKKTRAAIMAALSRLLEKKRYQNITVQDVIEEADVGRSTFYAHFETKDDLLGAICGEIFGHVFSEVLDAEPTHDFSAGGAGLREKLTHLLYHLRERKKEIACLLSGSSGERFMGFFKKGLRELFSRYDSLAAEQAPADFVSNHYVCSFAEAVKWWAEEGMAHSPEEVVGFYESVTK